jgi:putative membrane protein
MITNAALTMLASPAGRFDPDGRGWWLGPLIPLLWIALVALVVWLVTRRRRPHEPDPLDGARQILGERYARGELSPDEYRERLDHLRSTPLTARRMRS